jgi:hypothetical protein
VGRCSCEVSRCQKERKGEKSASNVIVRKGGEDEKRGEEAMEER